MKSGASLEEMRGGGGGPVGLRAQQGTVKSHRLSWGSLLGLMLRREAA